MNLIDGRIVLEDREIAERFVRATSPGGVSPDRAALAVELRVDVATSSLPPEVKSRLLALAGKHATRGDVLVVVSRRHHSQARNRTAARAELASLLARAAKDPPKRRTQSHPDSAVREERLAAKHRRSATKQERALRALV